MIKQEAKIHQAIITDLLDGFIKVVTPFDSVLVEYYRSLPSRKWCSEYKYWKFPSDQQKEIEAMLNQRCYEIIHKSFRPVVHIREKDGNESEVSCNYDQAIYHILHAVDKSRWDPIRECFIINHDQINGLINELNTKDIEYDYSKITNEARSNFVKSTKAKTTQ